MIEYLRIYTKKDEINSLFVCTGNFFMKETSFKDKPKKNSIFLLIKRKSDYFEYCTWLELPKTFFKWNQSQSDYKQYWKALGLLIDENLKENKDFRVVRNFGSDFSDFLEEYFDERKN